MVSIFSLIKHKLSTVLSIVAAAEEATYDNSVINGYLFLTRTPVSLKILSISLYILSQIQFYFINGRPQQLVVTY
jgi:hypothetical protein